MKFQPGNPGGPGRPVGSFSFKTLLEKELEKVPAGEKRSYAELLVSSLVKKAVREGDVPACKEVFNRMEGLPRQPVDHSGEVKFIIDTGKDGKNN